MGIKILIVEDEVIVAEELAADLEDYGFSVTDIAISSEECFATIKANLPHVILMDINIKGELDGIKTSEAINKTHNIPIVYLTANTDTATINRALATSPSAFISKPYNKKDIVIALEIAFNKHNEKLLKTEPIAKGSCFFVKNGDYYTKINLEEVYYIEADGSYSKIYTHNKNYTLSSNLNHFQDQINNDCFARIHRSYIVNIKKVEAFDKNSVIINEQSLPISKSHQKEIINLFTKL
jgi:DNA-binding LytR/AlgR family response regulator